MKVICFLNRFLCVILYCLFYIIYDDYELFYIDEGNDFGDDEYLESEFFIIFNVENDLDINKGY